MTSFLRPDATLVESRYQFVDAFLTENPAPKGGGMLFEIGAGASPMKAAAESAGYAWRGFDLFPQDDAIEPWDITTPLKGDPKADVVLLMDVIEHTFNPGMALANIAKLLKPNGRLIMTMPNPRWSRARTLHLGSGFLAAFTQHDLDVNHHVFATFPHIVLRLVDDSGLKVEKYVTLDRDEVKLKLSPALPLLAVEAAVRKLIEIRDPSATGMHYGLVLSPKIV